MAYKCQICGKGVMFGHNVSHAKNRTRRVFRPNLRQAKLQLNGEVKRISLCMKCFKKAKKEGRFIKPTPKIAKVERVEIKKKVPEVVLSSIPEIARVKEEKEKEKISEIEEKKKIEEIVGRKG